jgi:SAM-dependent methyltransferase
MTDRNLESPGPVRLSVPVEFRRGVLKGDERASVRSASIILDYILECTGLETYEGISILDFGCGVKFTQALLQDGRRFRRYFGVDVFGPMIQFLRDNVTDPRFTFEIVPFQNDMYNKNGTPMTALSTLPCGNEQFDLITLQSVFTHLCPDDFQNLLFILRRYVTAAGRMFFTCFVDNEMREAFRDADPDKPLLYATHREDAIREMIQRAGWKVTFYSKPRWEDKHVVDHFVCIPA